MKYIHQYTICIIFVLTILVSIPSVSAQTKNSGRIFYLVGDGVSDDTEPLNAWGRGEIVIYNNKRLGRVLQNGVFLVSWKVEFNRPNSIVRCNTFILENAEPFPVIKHSKKVKYYKNIIEVPSANLKFVGNAFKFPYLFW